VKNAIVVMLNEVTTQDQRAAEDIIQDASSVIVFNIIQNPMEKKSGKDYRNFNMKSTVIPYHP